MSLIARAPSTLSSSASKSLGKKSYGNQKWTERGNPLWAATQEPNLAIIMNNLLKALSQHATQGGTMTKLGLLKSGKLTNRWMIERCNPL